MKRKPTHSKFLYLLFGLAALAGLLMVFLPLFQSLPEPKVSPIGGESIGLTSIILLTFPAAMNPGSVESRISVQPDIALQKKWNGNTLTLTPLQAFTPESELTLFLSKGSTNLDGKAYKTDLSWKFHIRMPDIAYLGQATTSPEIFVTDLAGKTDKKITQSKGNVTGFVPMTDGSGFYYSVKNDIGGGDIHRVNRDGSQDQVVVDCGKETCGDPTISKDGMLFAFSRNRDPEDGTTSTKSYIYTGLTAPGANPPAPLAAEKKLTGILPSFSPDGLKISFYDATSKGIRVMNEGGENDFFLGTNRIQSGCWSPDGAILAFVDDVVDLENFASNLYMVDLASSSITEPLKSVLGNVELGEPDWSPDGKKIAVGVRAVDGYMARQMAIMDLAQTALIQITHDFTLMNAAPKWRPDGKAIVFQQAQLGLSGSKPKVIVWNAVDGSFTTAASDAAMPAWIP